MEWVGVDSYSESRRSKSVYTNRRVSHGRWLYREWRRDCEVARIYRMGRSNHCLNGDWDVEQSINQWIYFLHHARDKGNDGLDCRQARQTSKERPKLYGKQVWAEDFGCNSIYGSERPLDGESYLVYGPIGPKGSRKWDVVWVEIGEFFTTKA